VYSNKYNRERVRIFDLTRSLNNRAVSATICIHRLIVQKISYVSLTGRTWFIFRAIVCGLLFLLWESISGCDSGLVCSRSCFVYVAFWMNAQTGGFSETSSEYGISGYSGVNDFLVVLCFLLWDARLVSSLYSVRDTSEIGIVLEGDSTDFYSLITVDRSTTFFSFSFFFFFFAI